MLVSVIIPAFNVEKHIEKSISSVIKQSYNDIEVIVIDDGSTDKTGSVVGKLCDKDTRIKYFYQDNIGLSGARNTGIEKSSGDFLLFLDGDDWIEYDAIKTLVSSCSMDNSDICIFNMKYIYEDGKEKNNTPQIIKHEVIDAREALKQELIGRKYKFHAPNKFVKKSIFIDNDILFPEGRLYEDLSTTYKLLSKAKKITLIDNYLYYYVQKRKGSITSGRISDKMFGDLFAALDDVITYVRDLSWNYDDEIQSLYIENVISISNYLLDGSDTSQKYYNSMRLDKNWQLMNNVLMNRSSSFVRKLRGFAIAHFWKQYSFLLRKMKGI